MTPAQQADAFRAKTFLLKDVLVQVLKKLGPDGAPVEGIPGIFYTMTGKHLNPFEFGFRSMAAMVDSFNDICQVGAGKREGAWSPRWIFETSVLSRVREKESGGERRNERRKLKMEESKEKMVEIMMERKNYGKK